MSSSAYEKLGASASKEALHNVLDKVGIGADHRYFAKILPDFTGDKEYASFIHADGCGTKSIVSYLLDEQTGDPSYYKGLAQDAIAMNIDDVYCLGGEIESLSYCNLINRNSRVVGESQLAEIIGGYLEVEKMLEAEGITLLNGGGETADCNDLTRTVTVDAIITGRIKRRSLIDTSNIKVGDSIIGLESGGKASYESFENSGIGSNGLTLARHSLIKKTTIKKLEYVDDLSNQSDAKTYYGNYCVTDKPDILGGLSVGEAMVCPTRIYAPVLKAIFNKCKVNAAINVTGGGLTKCIRFGVGKRYVKDNLLDVPPIFKLIQDSAGIDGKEMHQVFNMGQRVELFVNPGLNDEIIGIARNFGLKAQVIGRVEKNPLSDIKNEVVVDTKAGTFSYS